MKAPITPQVAAVKLPLAPERYDKVDQDRTRHIIEDFLLQLQQNALAAGVGITIEQTQSGLTTISTTAAKSASGANGGPMILLDGDDGEMGYPGPQGPRGTPGTPGASIPGLDGDEGSDGPPGPPGATGPQGPAGATGPAGPAGTLGVPGFDGLDGDDGMTIPGPAGAAGAAGAPGATGPAGATGAAGPPGLPGTDGDDADSGPFVPDKILVPGSAGFVAGDILYAQDANTLVRLPVGTNGQVLQVASAIPAWVTPGSSTSGNFSYYDPDKPQASPPTQDDEFTGTSLNARWTQVNWPTGLTTDQDTTKPSALFVKFTTGSSNVNRAILQTLPAGDFTIQTWVECHAGVQGTAVYYGLMLADGTTAGAGNQWAAALVMGTTGWQIFAQTGASFTGFGSTQFGGQLWEYEGAFIRIARLSGNIAVGFSLDGRTWFVSGTIWAGITPTKMGVFCENNSTALSTGTFMHFRYNATANFLFGGNRTVLGS